jgi:hypothetical protein
MMTSGEAGEAATEGEDDMSAEELFDEATLKQLRSVIAGIKGSQYAASFNAVVAQLSKKQREALGQYGA